MLKKITKLFAGIILVLILGIAALVYFADYNKFKPMIAEKTKEATGFDLLISGDIKPSFSPLGLKVTGLSIANPQGYEKGDMLKLDSFAVALQFKPLLKGKIKVDYLLFSDIDVNLIKSKSGKFNFEGLPQNTQTKQETVQTNTTSNSSLPPINVDVVKFENINIKYSDLQSGSKADIEKLNLTINNISLTEKSSMLAGLSFDGVIDAKKVDFERYFATNLKGKFSFKDMIANLNSLEYTIFDSDAKSSLSFNLKNEALKFSQTVDKLNMQTLSKVLAERDLLKGNAALKMDISFVGTNPDNIKKTLNGAVFLSSKDLHLNGYDIDAMLEQSTSVKGLVGGDGLGSLFASLPSNLGLSKEKRSKTVEKISNGATIIKNLNIKVPLINGEAKLEDVAFSTSKSIIVFKGSLNLPNEKFNNLQVASLDKNDCISFSQTIDGSFNDPKIKVDSGTVSTIANIAGMFLKKDKDKEKAQLVQNAVCEEGFYVGAVANPKK